jgi:hypothetical protein
MWLEANDRGLYRFSARLLPNTQIQLLLGHASIQTTERYLGTKQDLVQAVNDRVKIRVEGD